MSNIRVILTEALQGVGKIGDHVAVRAGFARNFLLPRRKAMVATKANIAAFEAQKAQLEAANSASRAEAEKLATKFTDLQLIMQRPSSETGQLYGSIKAKDIATQLAAKKLDVATSNVMIGKPIKDVGEHSVQISLHPEVIVTISVVVQRQSM
jgi:large subunit ribosomal protein L9